MTSEGMAVVRREVHAAQQVVEVRAELKVVSESES
jgi:hypothetical protein